LSGDGVDGAFFWHFGSGGGVCTFLELVLAERLLGVERDDRCEIVQLFESVPMRQ